MAVDLHIYTVASGNGDFSPQEIIQFAKPWGILSYEQFN